MHLRIAIALVLAATSTTLTNLAYIREQRAASALPPLSLRRPVDSARSLLRHRDWLTGFLMEGVGFGLYAAALALASLALVQSVGAGGIGVLGSVCTRRSGSRLSQRQVGGVIFSVLGLLALALSLMNGGGEGRAGSLSGIFAWLGGTALLAVAVLWIGRRSGASAVAAGVAGGLLFSMGDFSTKLATEGGGRFAFVITLVIGYAFGTSLIQIGYQRAGALTVAGLATLVTNALPIIAGTVVLHEPVPSGALGALRVLAFVSVTTGAILIAAPRQAGAQPETDAATRPHDDGRGSRSALHRTADSRSVA